MIKRATAQLVKGEITAADFLLIKLVVEFEKICDQFCKKPDRNPVYVEAMNHIKEKQNV